MAPNKARYWASPCAWARRINTAEIAPGPANIGTPSGVTAISSLATPASTSSSVSRAAVRRACSMSMAIINRSTLPAIWNAGKVTPNSLKIHGPVKTNSVSTAAAAAQASRAIRICAPRESLAVMVTNAGTTASGSTIANSEPKARSAYSKRLIVGTNLPAARRTAKCAPRIKT